MNIKLSQRQEQQRRRQGEELGKGQMGSALVRHCKFRVFDRGTFWVPIYQNMFMIIICAYLFPQSVKIPYFCSDPISVEPICPQPRSAPITPRGSAPSLDYDYYYYYYYYYYYHYYY